MKIIASLVVGLLASTTMGVGGFLLGCVVGYLLWEHREMARRLQAMETQVWNLVREGYQVRRAEAPPAPEAVAETDAPPIAAPLPASEVEALPVQPEDAEPIFAGPEPVAPELQMQDRKEQKHSGIRRHAETLSEQVRAFFFGGNTLVRVGLVVLFFGFAFLVKYAVDNDFFPLELRLAASAGAGIALTGLGWRLRSRRPDFALALQGGGMAILYLTIFATYRLYGLIPGGAAFALLVATTALGTALALLQNAQSLAVLSLLGGFFAPVLASTGEGSHVMLFSYYAVLNGGILALAWRRTWRPLHLVGFFCTFGIAGLWVAESYQPALFATTEPFLILFFLLYFVISILQARRSENHRMALVDGTLVFGLPVVVFSLQAGLVEPFPYGLAWSAFAFGCFYAAAAYVLYRRSPEMLRTLTESFAGIGLVLGTMVLPFALDATWTGTGWALEGGSMVWLGFRQRRVLVRLSGMLLQGAAGASFLLGSESLGSEMPPVFNRFFFGCLALAAAAFWTAFLVQRRRKQARAWERLLEGVFLTLGLLWWLGGGFGEIARELDTEAGYHLAVLFVIATALACILLRRMLHWQALRFPALLLLPALALMLLFAGVIVTHPFEAWGFLAWPIGTAVVFFALYRLDTEIPERVARLLHAAGLWFVAAVLTWEAVWVGGNLALSGAAWPLLGYAIAPVLLVLLVTRQAGRDAWPFGVWRSEYLLWGVVPLFVAVWYWSLYMSLRPAEPAPLPYLPLVNPLDLALGLTVIAGVGWYRTTRNLLPVFRSPGLRRLLLWVLSGTAFLWLNATLARTVHFWDGVPYDVDALLASNTFQTALTIFWTVLSVTTMAIAARRGGRTPWVVAASLLGVVVVKLFVVDLSSISTVARITTFIVVGLLLLLVGYLAPVPPQRSAPLTAENS